MATWFDEEVEKMSKTVEYKAIKSQVDFMEEVWAWMSANGVDAKGMANKCGIPVKTFVKYSEQGLSLRLADMVKMSDVMGKELIVSFDQKKN